MQITQINRYGITAYNLANHVIASGVYLAFSAWVLSIISKIPSVRGDFGGPDPEPNFGDYYTERGSLEARGMWENGREGRNSNPYSDFGHHISNFGEHALDLTDHALGGLADAASQNWAGAVVDSIHVGRDAVNLGKDAVDVAGDVVHGYTDSRTDAVTGGYAEHSDVGFQ